MVNSLVNSGKLFTKHKQQIFVIQSKWVIEMQIKFLFCPIWQDCNTIDVHINEYTKNMIEYILIRKKSPNPRFVPDFAEYRC